MKRLPHRKWFVIVGITILVEVYALWHIEAILYAVSFFVGRSDCSFSQTVAVADWTRRGMSFLDNTERTSRVIREDNTSQLWMTPLGEFWIPGRQTRIQGKSFAELQMGIYGSGSSHVQAGDVVLDCGAAIGDFTRIALNAGAALVVAVEPAKELKPCLERTFREEIAAGKVLVYPKGVWNKDEFLPLRGAGGVASVVGSLGHSDEVIQLTTIDALVAELALSRVDFIKMDIEGAERQALEGARRTLMQFKPRMAIATEHSVGQAREVRDVVLTINPSYTGECGPCSNLFGRIIPYVVYFR